MEKIYHPEEFNKRIIKKNIFYNFNNTNIQKFRAAWLQNCQRLRLLEVFVLYQNAPTIAERDIFINFGRNIIDNSDNINYHSFDNYTNVNKSIDIDRGLNIFLDQVDLTNNTLLMKKFQKPFLLNVNTDGPKLRDFELDFTIYKRDVTANNILNWGIILEVKFIKELF